MTELVSRRGFLRLGGLVGASALVGCGNGDRLAPVPSTLRTISPSQNVETTPPPIPSVTTTEIPTPIETVKDVPYWPIRCIDTMKESRDRAREDADLTPKVINDINNIVRTISDTGASHVAIGTPYDKEFVPVLTSWVKSAREHGLNVWFRGNFSGFEKDGTNPKKGWFDYDRETNLALHHKKTAEFITSNPNLFEKDDIFTPWPEPENSFPGGFYNDKVGYEDFLKTSYENAGKAFAEIGKSGVNQGYFSMNGDVAKELDPETVQALGNTVVIDHYVPSLDKMGSEIDDLHARYPGVNVILGEFGAPIPGINTGTMTQDEQAAFIDGLFAQMIDKKVGGMNYWTLLESSTELIDIPKDQSTPVFRRAYDTVKKYYTASKKKKK